MAADKFHGEVGSVSDVVAERAGVEDLCDVGVLEAGEDLRFELEAAANIRREKCGREYLERDSSVRVVLAGFKDRSHSAGAENAEYFVSANRLSDPRGAGKLSFLSWIAVFYQSAEDACACLEAWL